MSEDQLKRLLVVLCALAVVLTIVGAINAFEPLSLGFGWIIERIEAAFNWASERNPLGAAWDWALANDLPQGWAILVGVIIGLALIAWQLRIGFRNLVLSHANQVELDRQALREGALLEREAREHQAELQAQAQEAAQQKEAIVFAAALRGELMAAAYQLSSRLIWLEGVQKILDELAKDPTNRFPTPFEIERIATPVYDANAPRLATIDASLAADVAQVYAFLSAEHRWNEPGGRDPRLFKALIEKIRSANSVHLRDIVHVCKRLIAFELSKPDDDPGPLTEARKEWAEPLSELLEEGYVERFQAPVLRRRHCHAGIWKRQARGPLRPRHLHPRRGVRTGPPLGLQPIEEAVDRRNRRFRGRGHRTGQMLPLGRADL